MADLDLTTPSSLKGRRILISGGSRGLGRTLALAFLEDGAKVGVCARHGTGLPSLQKAGAVAIQADVADPEAVERFLQRLADEWGQVDGIVNNAAVFHQGRFIEQPLSEWRETIDINLKGAANVVRSAIRILPQGNIVNVTSGLSRFPMEPYGAYCIAKAGLNMLTRVLALELRDRCRVNAIDPGEIRTPMNPHAREDPASVVPVARALLALDGKGPSGRCFRRDGTEAPWD